MMGNIRSRLEERLRKGGSHNTICSSVSQSVIQSHSHSTDTISQSVSHIYTFSAKQILNMFGGGWNERERERERQYGYTWLLSKASR